MASMYRGVYLQNTRTIKFNARICNRYTRISLGSFKNAEEAALAYDRAAMKLHKDNASLNFPGLYTEEEVLFQRGKSEAEIIQMITNETYASELVSFVSRLNPHGRPAQVSNGSHQLLFYVNLINAEVGYQVLFLSKTLGLSHFPELAGLIPGEADSIRRTKIHFYDRQKFRSWTFEFCYLKNIETFVVTEDWGDFAEVSNLQEGDTVLFYRFHHAEGNNNRTLYMVDFLQRQPTVMLFGVQIS